MKLCYLKQPRKVVNLAKNRLSQQDQCIEKLLYNLGFYTTVKHVYNNIHILFFLQIHNA